MNKPALLQGLIDQNQYRGNMTKSLWVYEGRNSVRHSNGFSIVVLEGSFSTPNRIQATGGNSLNPIEHASLVREGMAFGVTAEATVETSHDQYDSDLDCDHLDEYVSPEPHKPTPTITYKRKRSFST